MLFTVKKLLGGLLMPSAVIIALLLLAVILGLCKKQRAATIATILAIAGLYGLSIRPVAHAIAGPLEFAYPAYQGQAVSHVVVLGGGHASDLRIPEQSQLRRTALARLMMGIDIYKHNPASTLLVSGYKGRDARSHAEISANIAHSFGVDFSKIKLAPNARDTREEAQAWKELLVQKQFVLVTSAMHMPRAMHIFRSEGLRPIAAPANYEVAGTPRALYWRDWLPKASNFAIVEAAWHEYLGMAWADLKQSWTKDN